MSVLLAAMVVPNPDEPEAMQEYLSSGPPLPLDAGGRVKFRARVCDIIAGQSAPAMMFVAEFDSAEAVHAAFANPAYQATIPARDRAFSKLDIVIMEEQ